MKYISTRGGGEAQDFEQVLLTGLAPDGGLYVPQQLPHFSQQEIASWSGLSYADLALKVITPFVGDSIPQAELKRCLDESYAQFTHQDVAPLVKLGSNEWILELYHGPTLAFKDFALQVLGRMLDFVLKKKPAASSNSWRDIRRYRFCSPGRLPAFRTGGYVYSPSSPAYIRSAAPPDDHHTRRQCAQSCRAR